MKQTTKQRLLNLTAEEISKLSKKKRAWLASHSTNRAILRTLSKDKTVLVRINTVMNEATPLTVRLSTVETLDENVRADIAANTACPEILNHLGYDKEVWVRLWVASNEDTPTQTLKQLAEDTAYEVREAVAKNNRTPKRLLASIADSTTSFSILAAVADNPNTSKRVLANLSGSTEGYVKYVVAGNPNTPPHILAKLARIGHEEISAKVAGNPNTGVNTLAFLLSIQDTLPNEEVILALAGNHKAPVQMLAEIIATHSNENVFDVLREREDVREVVHHYLVSFPDADVAVLDGLPTEWLLKMAGFPSAV